MSSRYYASYFPEAEEMNPFFFQDAKDRDSSTGEDKTSTNN